jgi:tetratricopeptide (TPR) repeat protein
VAKLPGIVRWLAFSGQSSDPADGMRVILESIEKGTYTPVGTRAALTLVQLRNELDPLAAQKLVDGLIAEHPHSPFFGSLRLIALYDSNQAEALAEEAQRQADLLAAGHYPKQRTAQVHFAAGLAEFRWMNWEKAEVAYQKAIEESDPTDPFVTWAKLHLGNIKDVRGDRRGARAIYREVEDLLNRWGTERLAERYLKKPFDPKIHQVRLLPDG